MPIAEAYSYARVLFGIIMILNLEIGYLTPPVGLNLVVAMTAFKHPFGTLCRAALPFIGLTLGCLALVFWQPWIAMGLVRQCAGQGTWAAAKRWAWSNTRRNWISNALTSAARSRCTLSVDFHLEVIH